MLYHCGLLDERPEQSRTLDWVKRGGWDLGLPADVERELKVWLAMPGFSIKFHANTLGVGSQYVKRFLGGYDEMRAEVAENWLSATREDCVKLALMRPAQGELPLLSQMQIMSDLKAGYSPSWLAREYSTNRTTIHGLGNGAARIRRPLPAGFELLVA